MASKNEEQKQAPVVVAAEPVVEPAKAPAAAASAVKGKGTVGKAPASTAVAAKAAPRTAAKAPVKAEPAKKAPAKAKPVSAKVQASQVALAKALATAQAVKLTPRPAAAKVDKAEKAEKAGKVAKAPKAAKPAKPVKAAKPAKLEKPKKVPLVRDSFTMPENEYAVIANLKKRLQGSGVAAKKSELLRAGVALLAALKDVDLAAAVAKVEKIKTGRPAKSGK